MKTLLSWRHQYDTKRDQEEGDACAYIEQHDSLTQQHFKDDADLNVIAQRFGLDKSPMPTAPFDPRMYGDFTNVPDLRTALDTVNDAKNRFMALPAKLRTRFDNDPAKLWDFVNDPENGAEAVRLGLLQSQPVAEQRDTPLGDGGTGT